MRLIDADTLKRRMLDYYQYSQQLCEEISDFFDNTPTIEPERKKGRWKQIHVGGFTPGGNSLSVCSECGWEFGTHMIYPDYNYCPNCGSYNGGDDA